MERQELGDADVGDAITVSADEPLTIDVALNSAHPAAGLQGRSGVGNGDVPVALEVLVVEDDLLAPTQRDRDVGGVVEEVPPNLLVLYPVPTAKSVTPCEATIFMMCHGTGLPPTSTIGLGRQSVSSRMRMPTGQQHCLHRSSDHIGVRSDDRRARSGYVGEPPMGVADSRRP